MKPNEFSSVVLEGQTYRTGCVPLDLHAQERLRTLTPVYEDHFPVWSKEEILDAIRNKLFKKRKIFDRSWIGNQGNFGSCNGYAGAKALERARHLRRLKRVRLSGEGLYSLMNGNRDNGSHLVDAMRLIESNGVPTEAKVGFGKIYRNQIDPSAYTDAANYRASELYRVESELALATGLLCDFMGVVAVHVGGDFLSMDSEGIVPPQPGPGNHAVGVQDVEVSQNGTLLFDHFGSWGAANHSDGCAYFTWNRHLAETNRYHGFYLIRCPHDSGSEVNPPMPVG